MLIKQFEEEVLYTHLIPEKLKGYIYEELFDQHYFLKLKKYVESIFSKTKTTTFKTQGATVHFEGKKHRLVFNKTAHREQHVMFDFSFDKEWYYQTPDTIKEWSTYKLNSEVSPFFSSYIHKIQSLPPYNLDASNWIPLRLHMNVLKYGNCLALHHDGSPFLYNLSTVRLHSLTFYLYDHIENCGGELWTLNGFVYKPKQNSAILLENGSRVMHGVSANMNPEQKTRLAFTCRFVHKDDLFLYGHPDKHLYKIDYFDDI